MPIEQLIYWIKKYFFVFLSSFGFTLIFTPLIKKLAVKFNVLDHPSERKIHSHPIALWGGLGIYLAYALALFVIAFRHASHLKAIIAGGLAVLLLGVIDDKKPVPATVKLTVLISLTFWLSRYGICIHLTGINAVDVLVTIFWIVGITSAFNSIDNMDGLATGVAGVASLMFFIVAFVSGQWEFGLLSFALCGASLGFLPFNFHPAKIFLGNGGSLFLGFTLGTIAVMGTWSANPFIAFTIPLLILSMPIFDILYVIILRYRQGLTPTLREIINYCGKDHLSHRLLAMGFKQRGVVVLLYLLSLCLGIGAIMLKSELDQYDAALLIFQAFIIILIMGVLLNIKANSHHS